jgi:putative thymidine phosphorylase
MLLKVKTLYLLAGRPIAILHEETARKHNLHVGDRIRLKNRGKEIVAPIDITGGTTILTKNQIALSQEIIDELKLEKNKSIEISAALKPLSINYISKKLHRKELSYTEIYSIISAIVNNELTEAEVAYFVSGVYLCGMSLDEIVSLTMAMVRTGQKLDLKNKIIIDKHSIGGVAGNRTTPIVTSIIGAFIDKYKLDAVMPKTSSRAITSAAGTADVVETICGVEFSVQEVKKILEKARACLVWGGSLGFAPADDKIIHAERILNLDPEAQLIASILSKKLAVNATHVLIDIAYGRSAKVKTINDAIAMKKRFEDVARHFNLNLRCLTTRGEQPIGNGIGPALEMRDILDVFQRKETRPLDLEQKSLYLASELLSFVTNMPKKEAYDDAKSILESGEAFKKFRQIIEAQGGSLSNLDRKLKLGRFRTEIKAHKNGKIFEIDHKKIASIARIIGCPADIGAGIFLHKHLNDIVKKNEIVFTIYAETKDKLDYAKRISERIMPATIS